MQNVGDLLNTSVSVKNNKQKNTNTKTLTLVTQIATKLSEQLNNPERYELYCKYAWKLPEYVIWCNLESAMAGRDPARLFTWLCERSLR